ncbi:hypothetical protein CCACVL1_00398 [Corchorus capsularis]|uniref:Uncharacterized protein n=1 Tax=Corchorus capsularis TaxID=210143 RepID=A0A1R3KWZ7_COCAP|nr:hypothetical protein CCACVL1_00398 [Corchorus capsularis]
MKDHSKESIPSNLVTHNREVLELDLSIPNEDLAWIYRSAVAELRGISYFKSVQDVCDMVGITCYVRPIGGMTVLLTFEDKETMEFFLKEQEAWFFVWFVSINPCEGSTCCNECFVWRTLENIPLQLWHHNFFSIIDNLWGSFVTVDDSTFKKHSLDIARMLVSIKRSIKIPSMIEFDYNDSRYAITIHAEASRDFLSFMTDRKLPINGGPVKDVSGATCEDSSSTNEMNELDSYMRGDGAIIEDGNGQSDLNEVEAHLISLFQEDVGAVNEAHDFASQVFGEQVQESELEVSLLNDQVVVVVEHEKEREVNGSILEEGTTLSKEEHAGAGINCVYEGGLTPMARKNVEVEVDFVPESNQMVVGQVNGPKEIVQSWANEHDVEVSSGQKHTGNEELGSCSHEFNKEWTLFKRGLSKKKVNRNQKKKIKKVQESGSRHSW